MCRHGHTDRQTDTHTRAHTQTEQAAHATDARNHQMHIPLKTAVLTTETSAWFFHDFSASAGKLRNRTLFCNLCREPSLHYFVFEGLPVTKGLI